MAWWQEQGVPRFVDLALRGADVAKYRASACEGLQGTVLEMGFGSGLNVPHYPEGVTEVLGVDPSAVGWRLAADRLAASPVPVRKVGLDGAALPLPDGSVDHVLSTFSLCTIPDVEQALSQVRRVLRPAGTFHFAEHGLAPDPGVERWQRRVDTLHARLAGGCHLTRPIVRLVEGAGLEVVSEHNEYSGRPKATGYITVGRAVAA